MGKRFWLIFLLILTIPFNSEAATISSGGGHIIQDEGGSLSPQRGKLNIVGPSVTCADDAGNAATKCTVSQSVSPQPDYYVRGDNSYGDLLGFQPQRFLLTNYDIEDGTTTGWTCQDYGGGACSAFFATTDQKYTGSYSIDSYDPTVSPITQQSAIIHPYVQYIITAYVRDDTASSGQTLRVRSGSYTGGSDLCTTTDTAANIDVWTKLTCTIPNTSSVGGTVYVQIVGPDIAVNNYFDRVQVEAPGFENPSTQSIRYRYVKEWKNCPDGSCLSFDGVDDYVTMGDVSDVEGIGAITVLTRFRGDLLQNSFATLVAKGSDTDSTSSWRLQKWGANNGIRWSVTNVSQVAVTAQQLGIHYDGLWHCVAGTYNGSNVKLYFDDNLVASETQTGNIYNSTEALSLGSYSTGSWQTRAFKGELDQTAIFNAALSQATIATYCADGYTFTGTETSMIHLYNLDSTSGTTATDDDDVGASNGTLTNISSPASIISGWNDCAIGGCLHFNGSTNYLSVMDHGDLDFSGADTITVEVLGFRPEALQNYMTMIGKRYSLGPATNYLVRTGTGAASDEIDFAYHDGSSWQIYETSNANLVAGTQYDIAVKFTYGSGATTNIIYKNGTALTGSWTLGNGTTNAVANNYPIIIGRDIKDGNYLKGRIAEIRIWDDIRTDQEIQDNDATECQSSWSSSNLVACWKLDDAWGTLATQVVDRSNIGNDANDCLSTTNPCRTAQSVVDRLPPYFSGDINIHLATGILPEKVTVRGHYPNGDYNITIRGYINPTANQFSDSAYMTGTSEGATNDLPKNARSLFNDSQASFNSEIDYGLLEITGGTGYIPTSGYDHRNWYRIEKALSATQLSIATRWSDGGVPGKDTTYNVYRNQDMSTIHGASGYGFGGGDKSPEHSINRRQGILIKDNSGIKLQKLRVKAAYVYNVEVINSYVTELTTVLSEYSGYIGISISNLSVLAEASKNANLYNWDGFILWKTSTIGSWTGNISAFQHHTGFGSYFSSNSNNIKQNIAVGNGYAGFDFENNFNSYGLARNRADSNKVYGLVIASSANISAIEPNTWTGNDSNIIVRSFSLLQTDLQSGVAADYEISNGLTGVFSDLYGIAEGSGSTQGITGWTYSGNITNVKSLGSTYNVSKIVGTNPFSDQVILYVNESTNVAGTSANDCILVMRMSDGTEVNVATLVLDGGCP